MDSMENTSGVGQAPHREKPAPPYWRAPWEFAVHVLVGTLIFAIIAAGAVLLDFGVRKLEAYGVGVVIIVGLRAGEYAIFGVDLVLFCVFLWRTGKRTVKDL